MTTIGFAGLLSTVWTPYQLDLTDYHRCSGSKTASPPIRPTRSRARRRHGAVDIRGRCTSSSCRHERGERPKHTRRCAAPFNRSIGPFEATRDRGRLPRPVCAPTVPRAIARPCRRLTARSWSRIRHAGGRELRHLRSTREPRPHPARHRRRLEGRRAARKFRTLYNNRRQSFGCTLSTETMSLKFCF
jgi:hypothetical protein